jgi:lactate dehydrogenase-like 2-hydroxyacid dehydrogenase
VGLINAKHQDITFFSFPITIAHHFSHLPLGGIRARGVVVTTAVATAATAEAATTTTVVTVTTSGTGVGKVDTDSATIKSRRVLVMRLFDYQNGSETHSCSFMASMAC